MVAMFALLGIANGVYHPADYAILSQLVSRERAGQAFSVHIFAGFLGTAVAPATMLILQRMARLAGGVPGRCPFWLCSWRRAFMLQPAALFEAPPKARAAAE